MNDTITLRDHRYDCSHGHRVYHDWWESIEEGTTRGSALRRCPGGKEITLTKVMAEWDGDTAVIRVDPGGEYWIDLETDDE